MSNFMQKCIEGVDVDFYACIDEWRSDLGHGQSLHEYLGMTEKQYQSVVEYPDILPLLIEKYKAEVAVVLLTRDIIAIKSALSKVGIGLENSGGSFSVTLPLE